MADRMPVVLLHGAMRTRAGMWPTAAFLRRHGFDARVFGYATRHGRLDDHAAELEHFIDGWLTEAHPALGFLTHSMGALVVRAYLGRPGAARQAHAQRLVMLSPPNRGSFLAERFADWRAFRWLYGDAVGELQRDRVRELPELPASATALVLAGGTGDPKRGYNRAIPGDNDGVIAVSEMGLPDAQLRFVGGSHSLLQWRPDVLSAAMAFLASAPSASAS